MHARLPSAVTSIGVLLVEDDAGDADLLVESLRDADHAGIAIDVRHVSRLAAALDLLARQRPDVVLLDLVLPDAGGLEAVQRVRAAAPDTPIVVLTGLAHHTVAVEAVQHGAQDYLVKGRVDGDLILRAIRYAMERERMQRALRTNEEIIRTALESAPIGMALVGIDGRFRMVNRALAELTGYDEAELRALAFQDITHPEDVEADLAQMRRLLAGEARSYEMEKRYVRKDGSVAWTLLTRSLVRAGSGAPRYFIVQVHDVTERKRAAERTHQLLAVTAALTGARTPQEVAERVATRVVGALGASLAAVAMRVPGDGELRLLAELGRPDGQLRGWARFPVSAPVPMAEVVRTGRPIWLESAQQLAERYPALDSRGTLPHVAALAILPLVLGEEIVGALAIGHGSADPLADGAAHGPPRRFTAEDRAMLQAVAHQCALALERARLYEAEQEASAAARAASEAKSRFLAVMSHELRTPLSAILGFAELVADGLAGPVTDKQRSHLARIRSSADHLLVIIEDILTLSRMEAGREAAHPEVVGVVEVVQEVVALFDAAAHGKGLTLGLELPGGQLSVVTDPRKLRQILVNLVGNAVKFTDAGGVDVRVILSGPTLAIQVADTGIGIAAEDVARVFEPFWQVDQRARRRAGGTGLGLDVSLRLARLLGGDLRVRSTLGAGSTFTLLLPRTGVLTPDARLPGAPSRLLDARTEG